MCNKFFHEDNSFNRTKKSVNTKDVPYWLSTIPRIVSANFLADKLGVWKGIWPLTPYIRSNDATKSLGFRNKYAIFATQLSASNQSQNQS